MNKNRILAAVRLACCVVSCHVPTSCAGSTVVYPYDNTSLPPMEVGGSIFVKANKNMWRASDAFNLTRKNFRDDDNNLGIWDGQELLLSVCFTGSSS